MKQGSLPRHGASNRSNPSTSTEIQEMMKRSQRALTKGSSLNFRITFFTSQDVFLDFVFPSDLPRLREFAAFQDLKKLFCLSVPRYLLHGAEMCSFALMINMIVMLMVLGLSSNAFKWREREEKNSSMCQDIATSGRATGPLSWKHRGAALFFGVRFRQQTLLLFGYDVKVTWSRVQYP